MLDWITIVIELIGVVILLMWIIIPIREFRDILQIVKHKSASPDQATDQAADPRRGFEVVADDAQRGEDGPSA